MKYVLLFLLVFTGCSTNKSFRSANTDSTVMVTNLTQTSGGSGTVISSDSDHSTVLTNAHVCEVIKSGGLVTTTGGIKAFATRYRVSARHDLCLIDVMEDLKASATLASTPPETYDVAIVTGHPRLLPNIVTFGHFSKKIIVNVMIGSRECTLAEAQDPSTALFCAFAGKMPTIKSYEAIVVSATIQPGSSGSGIFNSKQELSGVVFAGSGDLGYGMAVPYEYVADFLHSEILSLEYRTPVTILRSPAEDHSEKIKFTQVCAADTIYTSKSLCKAINSSTLYSE